MKEISASIFFMKRVFPAIWFGIWLLCLAMFFQSRTSSDSWISLVIPVMLFVGAIVFFGVFFIKECWGLADEVYDLGDALEFHRNGKVQRVCLKDITDLSFVGRRGYIKATIFTEQESKVEEKLSFALPSPFNPYSKEAMIRELTEKVVRARKEEQRSTSTIVCD